MDAKDRKQAQLDLKGAYWHAGRAMDALREVGTDSTPATRRADALASIEEARRYLTLASARLRLKGAR